MQIKIQLFIKFIERFYVVAHHFSRPTSKIVGDAMEQYGVHIVDVGFSIHRVAHTETLVPVFFARLADVLQGIEGVDRQCHLRQ